MKLIYIDVETTGIPCPQSGLIQLAGAIEIDAAKPVFFQYDIQPFPSDEIVEEALQVNGITREDMAAFTEPAAAYSKFISLLDTYIDRYNRIDKFHFIGYNAMFDSDHVRAWFEKNECFFHIAPQSSATNLVFSAAVLRHLTLCRDIVGTFFPKRFRGNCVRP